MTGNDFYKCSVDSELGLLGMNCGKVFTDSWECVKFFCVDMSTKAVVFEEDARGFQTHHWVVRNGQKYLSLQTDKNTVKMFKFDGGSKSFEEDGSLLIRLNSGDEINATEFDSNFEHVFILKNKIGKNTIFQKHDNYYQALSPSLCRGPS